MQTYVTVITFIRAEWNTDIETINIYVGTDLEKAKLVVSEFEENQIVCKEIMFAEVQTWQNEIHVDTINLNTINLKWDGCV